MTDWDMNGDTTITAYQAQLDQAAGVIADRNAEIATLNGRLAWLEQVASAAANLCRYYEKSVNVGPFSNNPRRESLFWNALRSSLARMNVGKETS